MEQLISMYAALQKYPVMVSYPDRQMHVDDFNYGDGYDHDFTTIYTFGPYKLEHTKVARNEELIFTEPGTTLYKRVIITNRLIGISKNYVNLSKAIKTKANGKEFKNPFEETINDSIHELQFYLTELGNTHCEIMGYDEIQETIKQLDTMKHRLLQTQNINYAEQNKVK